MGSGREPRAKLIARELREAILSGHLKPGTRLPQETVAEQYGGSRVPVQQALRELADQGLVSLEPNVGARVALFDLNELIETYWARESIEPMVLGHSVPRLSDRDLAEIERLVLETEDYAARGDRLGYIEVDRTLHLTTFRGADMPRLLRMIDGFFDTTDRYRKVYGLLPASVETSVLEHRLLLDHIVTRNAEDASRTLLMHIRRTRLFMERYVHEIEDRWEAGVRTGPWAEVSG
jgi:DNA-binding GntR family transcriptional regulator